MSLVAYAASSDEDSDHSEEEGVSFSNTKTNGGVVPVTPVVNGNLGTGTISDDEDDYAPTEYTAISKTPVEELDVTPIFAKLPLPKNTVENNATIEEEDDEFLHKKAVAPSEEVKPKPVHVAPSKGPVKITIPSLKDFSDVEKDITSKGKSKHLPEGQKKSSLLSMLPQAKSEQNFAKAAPSIASNDIPHQMKKNPSLTNNPFIPDAVKTRRPACNTEGVDGIKKPIKKQKPTDKAKKIIGQLQ
uniref:Uncharacterized protein n=1 Tax=Bactrocera latifrons TaxID=174628 RepID=A0A0K8W9E2_BACLA